MIDYAMATPAKFYAMAEWAGRSVDEFYEVYYLPTQDGLLEPTSLFYPTYYNSSVVRLYNFDGKAVVPTESIVVAYEEKVTSGGEEYREIINGWSFPTYEEAKAYISSQETGNYRIVGTSPFNSPVPLEKLNSYELVYPPEATTNTTTVKIFEYLGPGES
jgi:hypothetical protein